MEIRIIKARDLDEISEIYLGNTDERRLSIPGEKGAPKNILKQLKEFQLYDLRMEE